jgi:hypothetical protein
LVVPVSISRAVGQVTFWRHKQPLASVASHVMPTRSGCLRSAFSP